MIKTLAALSLLSIALPALAQTSSVENLALDTASPSIEWITCADCSIKPAPVTLSYSVPALKAGEQLREIRVVNGTRHLVTTDAMMGGSPVVHFALLTDIDVAELNDPRNGPAQASGDAGIDLTAKTSAVTASTTPAKPVPLKLDSFELRGTEH